MLIATLALLLQVGPNPNARGLDPLPFELEAQQRRQADEETVDTPPKDPLALCLLRAEMDPAAARIEANAWLETSIGLPRAHGLHCRGFAEANQGNWSAAAKSFAAARKEPAVSDRKYRARLGAIAANAYITAGEPQAGLNLLDQAIPDAAASNFTGLEAEMWLDKARAQVTLGDADSAITSLRSARQLAPTSSQAWLLSATLSRRSGDLDAARSEIEQAKKLNLTNPEISLEQGVIAVLSGDDDQARQSWQTVIDLVPGSAMADTAQGYLEQLSSR